MELLHAIEQRRARRAIQTVSVDSGILDRMARAATLAPSCFNHQPWRLIFVDKTENQTEHAAIAASLTAGNAWAQTAPVFCIGCTAPSLDCRLDDGRDYAPFDLGQSILSLQLQAFTEGLYAHPMAGFTPAKVRFALKIPADQVIYVVIAIGLPDEPEVLPEAQRDKERAPRTRKPLGDVVFKGMYGTAFS